MRKPTLKLMLCVSVATLLVPLLMSSPPNAAGAPNCIPKPTNARFRVLSFEIGSCFEDAEKAAASLGKKLEPRPSPSGMPDLKPYVIMGYGEPPEGSKPIEVVSLLMFDGSGRLILINENHIYSDPEKSKKAFAELDKALTEKYGNGKEIEGVFIKKWLKGNISITLDLKKSERGPNLRISYLDTKSSLRSLLQGK